MIHGKYYVIENTGKYERPLYFNEKLRRAICSWIKKNNLIYLDQKIFRTRIIALLSC